MKKTFLMKWEDRSPIPVVLTALLLGLAFYTLGDSGFLGDFGASTAHLLHNPTIHHMGLLALWPFFFVLGTEIKLNNVIAAGRVLLFAILGGMLVPFGLTSALLFTVGGYALTVALATGAGAMATDVALSIGAMNKFKHHARKAHWSELSLIALIILAIGDDLGGVLAMTFGFSDSLISKWALLIEAVICIVLWTLGNSAKIKFRIFDDSNEDKETDYHVITLVEHPAFWLVMALLNTWFLALAEIEPILGGCLVMIFAPQPVKTKLEHFFLPWSLRGLIVFGIVAGAVNVLNPEAWGLVTLLTFIGGFVGKQVGIFGGTLIGLNSTPPKSKYGRHNFNLRSAYSMSLCAAINGTVAIVFVNVALGAGYISADIAIQATLGYLLTIPAAYLVTYIVAPIFGMKEASK